MKKTRPVCRNSILDDPIYHPSRQGSKSISDALMISRRKEDEGEIGEELEMGGQPGEIPSATRVAVEIKAESASEIVPGIIDSQQITVKLRQISQHLQPPSFS